MVMTYKKDLEHQYRTRKPYEDLLVLTEQSEFYYEPEISIDRIEAICEYIF